MTLINTSADSLIEAKHHLATLKALKDKRQLHTGKAKALVTQLVDQRGLIHAKINDSLNTLKEIEKGIKELNLPIGHYGKSFQLKISPINREPVLNDELFKQYVESKGLDLLNFCKVDPKNPNTQQIIAEAGDLILEAQEPAIRHTFSK